MAGVNVISSFLSSLMDAAKDMCSSLPALVPAGLYLPSPPLYCPQPSPNTQVLLQMCNHQHIYMFKKKIILTVYETQDRKGTMEQLPEVACRHKVSGILQRLLLLLRSGGCCHPAAQWYISRLSRVRHILHKVCLYKTYNFRKKAKKKKKRINLVFRSKRSMHIPLLRWRRRVFQRSWWSWYLMVDTSKEEPKKKISWAPTLFILLVGAICN